MEFIKNFGLDPVLLFAQIVNFLIILYILRRFLYKPILSALEKRKQLIKEGLDKTEEARVRLEQIVEKEKTVLRTAQTQAKKILDDAKKESLIMVQKTEESTKIKAESILTQTREQIYFETREVEKRLTLHVSRLAVDFLQKAVKDLFSKEDQEAVMKNVLEKFRQKTN